MPDAFWRGRILRWRPAVALLPLALATLLPSDGAEAQEAPVRIEGELQEPRKIKHVDPKYPQDADRAGLAGKVVLDCVIDTKGRVQDVRVRRGVPPLTDAAVKAVRKWRYEPSLRDGHPIPVTISVTVNFKLRDLQYYGLLGSLDEDNEHLRESAARWLGRFRPGHGMTEKHIRKIVEALEPLAMEDESPRVRAEAARALSRLDGRPLPEGVSAVAPEQLPATRRVAWGSFIDPLRQSEIREVEEGVEIIVPPGLYDLSIELGRTTAPRLLRRIEDDFVAKVEVGRVSDAMGRQRARERRGYHGAGILIWQDEENYVRLESATYGGRSGTRYVLFERRVRGQLVNGLDPADHRIRDDPTSLRLERRGPELRAFARQSDGDWREIGRMDVDLPPATLIGVAAINTAESELAVTFRHFRLSQPDGS